LFERIETLLDAGWREVRIVTDHGWLWLPGKPTAKAKKLITKDNEWFSMKVKMVGNKIQIWVNGELMTEYTDDRYKEGHFAIQGHNPGQTIEVKELKYRKL